MLRGLEVFGQAPFDGVATQLPAGAGGEQRFGWLSAAFACPDLEYRDGLLCERCDAFLPALSRRVQVRAWPELHVGAGQGDHLGDTQAGLHGGEQQRIFQDSFRRCPLVWLMFWTVRGRTVESRDAAASRTVNE